MRLIPVVIPIMVSASSGTIDITDGLGGDLRGRLDGYDDATVFKSKLSTFVTDFSTAFNTQHALGFDKTGMRAVTFSTLTRQTH